MLSSLYPRNMPLTVLHVRLFLRRNWLWMALSLGASAVVVVAVVVVTQFGTGPRGSHGRDGLVLSDAVSPAVPADDPSALYKDERPPVSADRQLVGQYLKQAAQAQEEGDYETAIARCKDVLRIEPGNPEATQGLIDAEKAKRLLDSRHLN